MHTMCHQNTSTYHQKVKKVAEWLRLVNPEVIEQNHNSQNNCLSCVFLIFENRFRPILMYLAANRELAFPCARLLYFKQHKTD